MLAISRILYELSSEIVTVNGSDGCREMKLELRTRKKRSEAKDELPRERDLKRE